jgi:hypothetical protein
VKQVIDETKLRQKLQEIWKRKIPVTPSSFAEADALIDDVIKAATVKEIEEEAVE